MYHKTPSPSLVLLGLLAVYTRLSTACPPGYHTFYCNTCPETKCFNFFPEDSTFRKNFEETNSFCSGEGTMFGATGRLLEFRSSCEFERVRSLVTALNPTAPYLTGLNYDMQGNLRDSVAVGSGLSTILEGTTLQLTGAMENAGKCVAIGRTSESTTDLMVVGCNASAPSVCGLDTTALLVPTIDGETRRYVGPDGSITLTCRFSSVHLLGTTWLLKGEEMSANLGEGNSVNNDLTTSTLTFTQFNATLHKGAYQCRVQGLLGDLVSRTVDVLPAVLPVIQREPTDLSVYENGLAFFDCFPNLDTVPHPTVQWMYNGAPLDISNTAKYHVNPRTARLFISVVASSDEGQYSCTLSNLQGSVSSGTRTLTVLATPGGSPSNPGYLAGPARDTRKIEILQGTNLTVECVADTFNPSVQYTWTHPSRTGVGQNATDVDYPSPDRFGNLMLPNVQMSLSGEYEVQVRLPGLGTNGEALNANSPRSVNVDVQAMPTFTPVTTSPVVALGSDAVLTCSHNGNPVPAVAWFKNGSVVRDGSKYSVSNDSDTVNTLTIRNIQPADLTSYQCHLYNKRGSNVEEIFICGQPGVPGAVTPTVEPFTKDSVRITWDPPGEPNDDIELLTYNVYFDIRNFGASEAFTADVPNPDQTRAWNMRSVQVSGVTQQQFIVAYVVAVSASGAGALAAEQSYGITYGNTATVPPGNVSAEQTDDQTVSVSWLAIPSDRQPYVDSDISHYEVQYYSVGGAVQEANDVQSVTSTSLTVNITYQRNDEMVLAVRVRGITQLWREPVSFGNGPWSEVVFSGTVPRSGGVDTASPPPPLPPGSGGVDTAVIIGVVVAVAMVILLLGIAIFVILLVCVKHKTTMRCCKSSSSYADGKMKGVHSHFEDVKLEPNPAHGELTPSQARTEPMGIGGVNSSDVAMKENPAYQATEPQS